MYSSRYYLNDVYVKGSVENFVEKDDQKILVVSNGEKSINVYFDFQKLWDQIKEYEVGTHIALECLQVKEGKDEFLVAIKLQPSAVSFLSGIVCKGITKTTSKDGDPIVRFSLAMPGFQKGSTNFAQCECWDRHLFDKIKEGNYLSVKAAVLPSIWTDREGETRSSIRFRVQAIGCPKNAESLQPAQEIAEF